jgi:L-malate glycosyltransferase
VLAIPFATSPFDDDADNDVEAIGRRVASQAGFEMLPRPTGRSVLRVAHLDCGRGWRGGQNQVHLLMRALQKRGVRNVLIAPPGPLLERASAEGIDVIPWRARGDWDWLALAWATRALRTSGVSVAHCHDARSHALGVPAARLAGVPAVVVSRRVSFRVATNPLSVLKYRLPVDRYLCVSRGVIERLRVAGVPERRLALVPDGFELEEPAVTWDLPAMLGVPPGTPLVGTVAALTPEKGHADLLEAAARMVRASSAAHFVWLGEGKCRDALLRRRAELGLESRVHLLGYRTDAQALLRQCAVCALPSLEEGLGTSLIEAQALGVPVVATAVGGVPEVIENGRTGRLVPPGDPAALASALQETLASPELRRAWSEAGCVSARAFTADCMAERTLAEYDAILRASSRPS